MTMGMNKNHRPVAQRGYERSGINGILILLFAVIVFPFFVYVTYLTAIQDPDFVCGFKIFWGVGNGCEKNWR